MQPTRLLSADFPSLQLVRTGRLVRLFGRITLIALIVSVFGMTFVPWQQTARGIGVVIALDPQQRPQPVLSPSKGVITWVRPDLREGTYVEQGDELIRLTPIAAESVSQLQQQIQQIELKKIAAELSLQAAKETVQSRIESGLQLDESLTEQLDAAAQKLEQVKNKVPVEQAKLADKENKLKNAQLVFPRGVISGEELFTYEREVEAQRNQLLGAENAVKEAEADFRSKEKEVASKRKEIDIKNQEADMKRQAEEQKLNSTVKELIELKNKMGEFDRLNIVSPRSGFIQQWDGLVGSDIVSEKEQLFVVVPDATDLAFEMAVSGNDMPLIHEGDRVRLQFEGWPAVQFVGWPSVAVGTFGGKVNRVLPTDDGKGKFRVLVTPDKHFPGEKDWPDRRYLRQGVRANGWVLLRKVPLGYEIWRQLNGFPPVLSDEEPDKDKSKDGKASKVKLPKV